ncbi:MULTISPECIES: YidC/Oxa1 family membrane protein insertase [unclassified Desulfosporosinus]|uniref:YidC/Oxa1 family membrane protein insertase n=1 Tax=unclassified Desulfosporosinus TaxID=2633794 RepID=UPI000223AF23|nr:MULTISPECIES: YidC/Oxa1 family membrane protein insertase [unclassified Desulfosporosinus]EGW39026.1 60Kd inner membrane family protein [Desulfosporosinus sp. OT]ODA41528.1 Inner membrane protein translocase component YidC, short form OxaI-like protein [Desulfosporosinus sp. BG]
MNIIVQGMTYLLNILYNLSAAIGLPNYGVAIIILTILIKTLIYPLTYKQMASMRKTVDLQPKIKAIQAKYKNDKEKINTAVMELYKEHNVNPMGGCLPIVVQLPIFWALYSTLRKFPYGNSAAAAHWFLGFDLTKIYGFTPSYHIILPIFAAATTFLQTKVTNPNASTDPTQKTMLYIMPVFFAYISATVPAGLALYWVTMNCVSILQQLYINRRLTSQKNNAA